MQRDINMLSQHLPVGTEKNHEILNATCVVRDSSRLLPEYGSIAVSPMTSMVVLLLQWLLGYGLRHFRFVLDLYVSRQGSFLWQFVSGS